MKKVSTVVLGTSLLIFAGCTGSSVFVKRANKLMDQGKYGDAMVTYDAHLDDNPKDATAKAKRDKAARNWIRSKVKKSSSLGPRRAVGLLLALGKVARDRGLKDVISQDIAPALDKAVIRVWTPPKTFANSGAARKAILKGEALAKLLPPGAQARKLLAQLKQRAVAFHLKKAKAATHPGAKYLHAKLASLYGGPAVPTAVKKAYDRLSTFTFDVAVLGPKRCAIYKRGLRGRMQAIPLLPRKPGGMDIKVKVALTCSDHKELRTKVQHKSCTRVRYRTHVSRACRTRTFQTSTAKVVRGWRKKWLVSTTTYRKVPECTYKRRRKRIVRKVSGKQVEQRLYDSTQIKGWAYYSVPGLKVGRAFRLNTQMHTIHYKWRGPCGTGQLKGNRNKWGFYLGHALLIQLNYNVAALKGILTRKTIAKARVADRAGKKMDALGHMAVAARLPQRIGSSVGSWFKTNTGLDNRALKEVLLDAAHVTPTADAFRYKLALPKVDPALIRKAQEQKARSGSDGY